MPESGICLKKIWPGRSAGNGKSTELPTRFETTASVGNLAMAAARIIKKAAG